MFRIHTSNELLVSRLDCQIPGEPAAANGVECVFWAPVNGQMSLRHFQAQRDAHYEPHAHSEYNVMVCLQGELTQTEFGENTIAAAGQTCISNVGTEHSSVCRCLPNGVAELICLSFNPEALAAAGGDFQLPAMAAGQVPAFTGKMENAVICECARVIAGELERQEPGYKVVVEIEALRLLAEVLRAWPRAQIRPVSADATPRLSQQDFLRAYEYMRSCRKGTFRLQNLCSFLGISKERFTRLFLASTGQTPASFYNRLLLNRGLRLLSSSPLSVKEISFELGFKTNSHFIVAFRRQFDATPQEYRNHFRLQAAPPMPAPNRVPPLGYAGMAG